MRRIKPFIALFMLFGLQACFDDTAKQCDKLFNDENKRLLATPVCEKAAQNNDSTAQLRLGQLLLEEQQTGKAVEFLEKSANQKNAVAIYLLAELYEAGANNITSDSQKALFYYKTACQIGELKGCEKIERAKNQKLAEIEQAKLDNERAAFEAKKAENEAKLAEERRLLAQQQAEVQEAQKREAESKKQAELARQNIFLMKAQEIRQTYSDFTNIYLDTGIDGLKTWVNDCYARSNNKQGCLHLDLLAMSANYMTFKEQPELLNQYFHSDQVYQRAVANILELKELTSDEFEILSQKTLTQLLSNSDLFSEFSKKREEKQKPNLEYHEGLAKFEENGQWGYIDQNSNVVITPRFARAGRFSNGIANVQGQNKLWGYINNRGDYISPPQYVCSGMFREGLAGVYVNGYLDEQGKCTGGKWGFINTEGRMVINAVFDKAWGFDKGKAKVKYKGEIFYIDKQGKKL